MVRYFIPVVFRGQVRIRLSVAHEQQRLDNVIIGFTKVGKELEVLK